MRHSSDRPTTLDSPLRPSRRGPRGLSLTPRRFSHRPVFARLRLPTRRRARATWLVAYSAVTLPVLASLRLTIRRQAKAETSCVHSRGPRTSSSSYPKTSEGGNLLCSLPMSASIFLPPCLREPLANRPKVVSQHLNFSSNHKGPNQSYVALPYSS